MPYVYVPNSVNISQVPLQTIFFHMRSLNYIVVLSIFTDKFQISIVII